MTLSGSSHFSDLKLDLKGCRWLKQANGNAPYKGLLSAQSLTREVPVFNSLLLTSVIFFKFNDPVNPYGS